jgi:hypothetical protein
MDAFGAISTKIKKDRENKRKNVKREWKNKAKKVDKRVLTTPNRKVYAGEPLVWQFKDLRDSGSEKPLAKLI